MSLSMRKKSYTDEEAAVLYEDQYDMFATQDAVDKLYNDLFGSSKMLISYDDSMDVMLEPYELLGLYHSSISSVFEWEPDRQGKSIEDMVHDLEYLDSQSQVINTVYFTMDKGINILRNFVFNIRYDPKRNIDAIGDLIEVLRNKYEGVWDYKAVSQHDGHISIVFS